MVATFIEAAEYNGEHLLRNLRDLENHFPKTKKKRITMHKERGLIDYLFHRDNGRRVGGGYYCFKVVSVAATVKFLMESFLRRGNIDELCLVAFISL